MELCQRMTALKLTNKTKVICANSKLELRNVTVGEVA